MSVPAAALAAGVAAGLAAAVGCPPTARYLVRTRLPGRLSEDRRGIALRAPPGPRAAWLLGSGACGAAVLVALGPSAVLLAATAALVSVGVGWLHVNARRRHAVERGRHATVEACDALATELRAGQPALQALFRAGEQFPVLRPAAHACRLGGDVPAALRREGTSPGAGALATVAAAWAVAESSGSGLAAALQQVSESMRSDDAAQREVTAALAPARATARLLAVLPAVGLLLGAGLGGDPVGLLLTTPLGNLLLLGGVALVLAGMVWVERLAAGAES